MKAKLQKLRSIAANNAKKVAAAGSVIAAGLSGQALALPPQATSALAEVSDFATDMAAGVWPIVGIVVAALAGIGLFKKFISKAT